MKILPRVQTTAFGLFTPLHDWCRERWAWYTAWHDVPHATHVHLSGLVIGLAAIGLALATFSQPVASLAATGVNRQIPFQGRLLDRSGAPVNGSVEMVLRLYPQAIGGSAVWTERRTGSRSVTVTTGLFAILLGEIESVAAVDFNQDTWYLGITIGGDSEMTPRIRLGAAPYAINADRLDGLDASDFVRTTASADQVQLVGAPIAPATDNTLDLGSTTQRWRDLYLGPDSLNLYSTAAETAVARHWQIAIDTTDGPNDGSLQILEGATTHLRIGTDGTVTATGNLITTGTSYIASAGDLTVGDDAVISDDVIIGSPFTNSGSLTNFGPATLQGNVYLGGGATDTISITGNALHFTGAIVDDGHETTLGIIEPTADRTLYLPDRTGTLITSGDTGTVTSTMITDSTIATADLATGAVTSAKITDGTITNADLASGTYSNITGVGTLTGLIVLGGGTFGSQVTLDSNTSTDDQFVLEVPVVGSGVRHVGTLTLADLTAERTWTLPNATGTLVTTGDTGTVTSTLIADGAVMNSDINVAAAISYSKLNLSGSILSADIADGAIMNADINVGAAITYSKLALTDSIVAGDIATDAVGAAEIAANAVGTSELADTTVTANTYGSSIAIPIFTVDADGRLTYASTTPLEAGGVAADTLDLTELKDSLALDSTLTLTGTAGETINLVRTLTDATGENGTTLTVTASDTTSGTIAQYGLYLDNAASTEGLDSLLVLDNSDLDDVVGAAITLINAGGGFTNIFDNAGTLISGSELNLLDGGITLAELTDSGTLTAGTVDLNGGNIDGTTIGVASRAAGNFTNLDVNGTVTLPANSITDAMVSNTLTASDLVAGSAVVSDVEVVDALTISGGTIDNSVIGGTTTAAATVTSLTATSVSSLRSTVTVDTATATDDRLVLSITTGGVARFDGTLTAADLSAARTWTLPNVTGTLISTGDSGTVTTGMVLDGTIASADIADDTITAGDIATGAVTTTEIADGTVSTTDIADGTIASVDLADGVVSSTDIADDTIVNTDVNSAAAIAYSKLNLTGSVVNADVSATAAIAYSKLNLSGAIVTGDIALDTILATDIATGAVGTTEILDGTILAGDLADGAVTTAKILDDTIINADVNSAAAIAYSKLNLASSITSADIAADAVEASEIATGAVGTAEIADGVVSSTDIADATIVNADLAGGSYTGITTVGTLTGLTVSSSSTFRSSVTIDTATATDDRLAFSISTQGVARFDGSLTIADLTAARIWTLPNVTGTVITTGDSGTVTSTIVTDDTIVNADINSAAAIAYSKLNLASSILSADIAADTIAAADIAADAVGSSEIAADAVGSSEIAAGAVGTSELADGAVSSTDIADDTIVNADINSAAAVAYSKLNLAGSIVTGDIAADTILAGDIATGAVGTAEIADGVVTSTDIADATIVNADLAGGSYTGITTVGTLTGLTVTGASTLRSSVTIDTATATDDRLLFSISTQGIARFDGSLTIADLSAARIWTLPNVTGTLVTTGDTGTVTSTIVADDTLVNADINSAAAIAYSKLNLSGSILTGDIAADTIAAVDIATGAVATAEILDGTIVNADLAGGSYTGITAVGTLTTLAVSGDITFSAATPSIAITDGETFAITDGTNTLFSLADGGTTGTLARVSFDANGSGNSLSNVENTDLVNDTLDFDKFLDAMALDAAWTVTGTAGETINLNRTLTDATAENGATLTITASDTTSATAAQYGLYVDNAASTEGLDSLLVLDNSDLDDAVGAAITIVNAGGGFTNVINNAGTLISGTELNLLDGKTTLVDTDDAVAIAIIGTGALNAGSITSGFGAIDVGTDTITTTGTVGTAGSTTFTGNTGALSGALAANGGITLDAATDTISAFTAGGTIDLGGNILTNIGHTGTDFVATTGALTLAGTLTLSNNTLSCTGCIDATDIATDAVGAAEIAADAVGTSEIATGGVGAAEIGDDVIDLDDVADALALDSTLTLTGTAGETINLVRTLTDATAENSVTITTTAADTTSGTAAQYGLYVDNAASTEGLDSLLVLDNSDLDDAVGAAITLINAGGGFTNVINNAGTLISGTELNLLDSGIALSELTNSGTLTATTVDINGGNIDGTAIGAASASSGAFTTLTASSTLTVTGAAGFDGGANPANAGDEALGTTSLEWDGLYVGDDGVGITFGADQDVRVGYVSASSSLLFALGDGNTLNVDGDGSPTADLFKLGNGDTSATDGVDALQITFTADDASGNLIDLSPTFTDNDAGNSAETWNVIDIDALTVTQNDSGGAVTGLVRGLNIGNLTESATGDDAITSNALLVGTGWDTILGGTTAGTNILSFTNVTLTTGGDLTLAGGDIIGANSAAIDVGEATSGSITFTAGGTGDHVFTVDSDTKVGVGTATPDGSYTMTINGTDNNGKLLLTGGGTDSQNGLVLDGSGGGDAFYLYSSSLGISVYNNTDARNDLTIDNTGSVGVGDTTPDAKFDIDHTVSAASSADSVDITSTVAAQDGSDTYIGIDLNITGADHSGASNVITGLDLSLTTPDAQSTESAIVIGSNWDNSISIASGELLMSGGNLQLNDNINATFGTGDDLTIVHNGTDTIITSATGNLNIDNTSATGTILLTLGTDTSATSLVIENNSGTDLFSFLASGALQVKPYGTGAGNTGEIEFLELAANGSNYVAFKAPDSIAANVTWTLPSADGSAGQTLVTNGTGTLSWAGSFNSARVTELTRASDQSTVEWASPYGASQTTQVSWTTEDIDGLGVFDSGSPTLITIQTSGWYRIHTHVSHKNTNWTRFAVTLNNTGWGGYLAERVVGFPNGDGSEGASMAVTIPFIQLAANDVLRVTLVAVPAGTIEGTNEPAKFFLERID